MESMKSKLYYYKIFYEMEDKWEYYRMRKVKRHKEQTYEWYDEKEEKWRVSYFVWGDNQKINSSRRVSALEILLLFGQEALTHSRIGRRPLTE
jgi:hypothetical protein